MTDAFDDGHGGTSDQRRDGPDQRALNDERALKRELSRLVRGDPVPSWQRRRVVLEARAAASDVDLAAAFAADGGVDRLERAVAAAERGGEEALARRGRRLRRAYAAFERDAPGPRDPSVPPRSRNP